MNRILGICVLALAASTARADFVSYTGTLASAEDAFVTTFTLSSAATIGLQTWGFGGGTNAAGDLISPGGTDPFLGVFAGTGTGASILTDGLGDPYATSLDLSNYGNPDFLGCPPAGAPVIGGAAQCGDITMTLSSLAAGTYTVVLSDGQYIPQAVFDLGTLGEGFSDLTGGAFCNIDINGVACPNTSGAYALDITGLPAAVASTPEPAGVAFALSALLVLAAVVGRRRTLKPTLEENQ